MMANTEPMKQALDRHQFLPSNMMEMIYILSENLKEHKLAGRMFRNYLADGTIRLDVSFGGPNYVVYFKTDMPSLRDILNEFDYFNNCLGFELDNDGNERILVPIKRNNIRADVWCLTSHQTVNDDGTGQLTLIAKRLRNIVAELCPKDLALKYGHKPIFAVWTDSHRNIRRALQEWVYQSTINHIAIYGINPSIEHSKSLEHVIECLYQHVELFVDPMMKEYGVKRTVSFVGYRIIPPTKHRLINWPRFHQTCNRHSLYIDYYIESPSPSDDGRGGYMTKVALRTLDELGFNK